MRYGGRMGSQKQRDMRQVVFLNARLRTDEGWSDITICNLSARGLMAKCAKPPAKGAFVEVRRGGSCIVGQVRWSQGMRFGLRSQDRIDTAALHEDPKRTSRRSERRDGAGRAARRKPARPAALSEARSRNLARYLDWAALAVAGIVAAGFLFQAASSTLSAPLREARSALVEQEP
jgi:hypothetical protein